MRNPRKHHSSVLLKYFLKGWEKKQEYSSRNSGTTSRSQKKSELQDTCRFFRTIYPHTQEKREKTGKGVPYSPKPGKMKIPTKKNLKPGKMKSRNRNKLVPISMELNHPKSRKRENPKQRKSGTIYKISLQPNPEKKTKKVMVPEFPALYHPKPKKTKHVEKKYSSGNPRTISPKTWKHINIRNKISISKDLELYHPKPKKQPGRKLQFQTSRNYKPEKQTKNVIHKTSGYLIRPFCIQAAQRTLYIFWSEASVASRQVKPCLGGEMCQSTPRISLCYHGKKQNTTWPKHQQEGRMQEKHLEFTQIVEKRRKKCLPNTRRNRKQHIYLRKQNNIFPEKVIFPNSQKTSLIPQKSEMPKKNKNLLPKYIYSRKNLLSKKM